MREASGNLVEVRVQEPWKLAVQKAMQDPLIAKRLGEIGADIPPPAQRSPDALRHLVNSEVDKWVPLIKAAGIVGQ
jgi:tripartite-type tricarboxylate transporter receptor subunit TctC